MLKVARGYNVKKCLEMCFFCSSVGHLSTSTISFFAKLMSLPAGSMSSNCSIKNSDQGLHVLGLRCWTCRYITRASRPKSKLFSRAPCFIQHTFFKIQHTQISLDVQKSRRINFSLNFFDNILASCIMDDSFPWNVLQRDKFLSYIMLHFHVLLFFVWVLKWVMSVFS